MNRYTQCEKIIFGCQNNLFVITITIIINFKINNFCKLFLYFQIRIIKTIERIYFIISALKFHLIPIHYFYRLLRNILKFCSKYLLCHGFFVPLYVLYWIINIFFGLRNFLYYFFLLIIPEIFFIFNLFKSRSYFFYSLGQGSTWGRNPDTLIYREFITGK